MTSLSLRDSILATLAYFDLFSYPLTTEELFRFLWAPKRPVAFREMEETLALLMREQRVGSRNEFWFLSGQEEIVPRRQEAVSYGEEKIRRAQKAARCIAWIPFVKAMFVCNTVGMGTAREESDIDVFIVVKDKRLWLARLLITLTLSIVGLRRTKTRIANQICLSFFVTNAALDLAPLTMGSPDVYLMYWLDLLIPVYDPENTHRALMAANTFAKPYLPHAFGRPLKEKEIIVGVWSKRVKRFFERAWGGGYGALLEGQTKAIQQSKMRLNTKSVQDAHDTRVVETDQVLKFHEHDRRAEYREAWIQRCQALQVKPYDGAWS